MRKLISTILSVSAFVLIGNAQPCGTNGPSACSPTGGPASGGFQDLNTVACAEKGVAYSGTIQFTMFDQFNFQGQQTVDSMEFVSITNLPCGLCWAVNQADKRYTANEDGCISITGTTNDASGQYKLALSLKAWINGTPVGITVPASLVDQTGIALYLRVKDNAGANCPNVDTASSANNLTASSSCPVGINDIAGNVSEFKIVPNPMNSQANVSFFSAKQDTYTMTVADLTGKQVYVTELEVKQGYNNATISRNELPTGMYFLYLTDGKNTITKRFTIAD